MAFGEASKKEATRIMLARLRNIRQREEKRRDLYRDKLENCIAKYKEIYREIQRIV